MPPSNRFLQRAATVTSPALQAFMSDFREQTERNPFAPRMRIWRDLIGLEVTTFGGMVDLGLIVSLSEKGAGNASAAMQWFVELADVHQVTLTLDVSPLKKAGAEGKSLTTSELFRFYAKFGFKKDGYESMIRKPT